MRGGIWEEGEDEDDGDVVEVRRDGGLGHGDGADQLVPKQIEALRDVTVVAVAAGSGFSLATDADGGTHTFGYCPGGLGVGVEDERVLPTCVAFEDGA